MGSAFDLPYGRVAIVVNDITRLTRTDLFLPPIVNTLNAAGVPDRDMDIDLRQAHKGLENACRALRPGGTILFYAECPKGAGIKSFEDYIARYRDDFEMQAALEREFVVGGHKAYWVARLGRCYQVHLVSGLDEEFVRRCHFQPVSPERHETVLEELLRGMGPRGRVAVIPYSGFTLPVSRELAEVTQT